MKILVTGGHGFIGSTLVRKMIATFKDDMIINVDCNTYAANPSYVDKYVEWAKERGYYNYRHELCDIRDTEQVERLFAIEKPDHVIHLAAESHVCNSIKGPRVFYETNVMGTFNLLENFRKLDNGGRFLHVSTDEVFGELPLNIPELKFMENTPMSPRSPYAASKAASDHMVQAYHHTYGMDTIITNCTNNYGPNQHCEKLIPRTIKHILTGQPVVIHGKGDHVRDWIFVDDHCDGLLQAFHFGVPGEKYLFGGENEKTNVDVIKDVHMVLQNMVGHDVPMAVRHTDDRPSDDERYAANIRKASRDLNYIPKTNWFNGLEYVINWYMREFDWSLPNAVQR